MSSKRRRRFDSNKGAPSKGEEDRAYYGHLESSSSPVAGSNLNLLDPSNDLSLHKGHRRHRPRRRHQGHRRLHQLITNSCLLLATRLRKYWSEILRQNSAPTTTNNTYNPMAGKHASFGKCGSSRSRRDLILVFFISVKVITLIAILLFRRHNYMRSPLHRPILIQRFDFALSDDVGGWTDRPYTFRSLSSLGPMPEMLFDDDDEVEESGKKEDKGDEGEKEDGSSSKTREAKENVRVAKEKERDEFRRGIPHYGGIEYRPVPPDRFYRFANDTSAQKAKKKKSRHVSHEFAFDDDEVLNPDCRRPNWWSNYFPTCNNFHEYDASLKFDGGIVGAENHEYELRYIAHGFFRNVWLLENYLPRETMVLKMLRTKHDFDLSNWEMVRIDALVMERLSSSPRIMDAYGHCGFSIMAEAVQNELEELIVPNSGYADKEDLDDSQDVDPFNDFSPPEKLDIALAMAESIADLHGFEDGIIVHGDVQLCQWLKKRDGTIKLGDFNRAEILFWDEDNERYCKHTNWGGYGNYRSPEEFDAQNTNEQIDVFSLGNNIYGLLTGLWVFYENEDDEVVQKKIMDGETAFIDERYRTRSYIEGRMVEIIERCWDYKPEERATIFEVVEYLRETKETFLRLEAAASTTEMDEESA